MSHLGRARVVVKNPNKKVLEEALTMMVKHCEQYSVTTMNEVITVTDKRTNSVMRVTYSNWGGIQVVASSEYQGDFTRVSAELTRHIKRFYNARANILAVQKMGLQAEVQYGVEDNPEKIRIIAMQR